MCEYIVIWIFWHEECDKNVVDKVDVIFHVAFTILGGTYFDYEHLWTKMQ